MPHAARAAPAPMASGVIVRIAPCSESSAATALSPIIFACRTATLFRIRNRNKVAVRQAKIIGESAVAAEDSEHGAMRTMTPEAIGAGAARAACGINLANDAAAAQGGIH